MKFKSGDQVRMLDQGVYYYGEITIVRDDEPIYKGYLYKVLFVDGDGPDYTYYREKDLELMTPEMTCEARSE